MLNGSGERRMAVRLSTGHAEDESFLAFAQPFSVMAGQKPSKDGVALLAYVPATHAGPQREISCWTRRRDALSSD
jgi:hypothetical protein